MDFNKLWQNFMDTLQNHYMDFAGRVGRTQFWYFILVCFGILIVAALIDAITRLDAVRWVVGLALLLPTAGIAARRMQDTGQNGQLSWIWVVIAAIFYVLSLLTALSGPFGGLAFLYFLQSGGWFIFTILALAYVVVTLVIIYFCAQPGQAGDNAYGPPPPVFNPGPAAA
jgi:uncharacterized membrane protein YhaH (DUF805 family)